MVLTDVHLIISVFDPGDFAFRQRRKSVPATIALTSNSNNQYHGTANILKKYHTSRLYDHCASEWIPSEMFTSGNRRSLSGPPGPSGLASIRWTMFCLVAAFAAQVLALHEDCNIEIPLGTCEANENLTRLWQVQDCLMDQPCVKKGGYYTIKEPSLLCEQGVLFNGTKCLLTDEGCEEGEKKVGEEGQEECVPREPHEAIDTTPLTLGASCGKYRRIPGSNHACPSTGPLCFRYDGACEEACKCPPKQSLGKELEDPSESCVYLYSNLSEDPAQTICEYGDFTLADELVEDLAGLRVGSEMRAVLFSDNFDYSKPVVVLQGADTNTLTNLGHWCLYTNASIPSVRNNGTNCHTVDEDGQDRISTWADVPTSIRLESVSSPQSSALAPYVKPVVMLGIVLGIV